MASPFSVFRKNQKVMMAGVTILAIVAFVFLSGPAMRGLGGSGNDAAVVRTTKFGNVSLSQLRLLRENRVIFNSFLASVRGILDANHQPLGNVSQVASVIGLANDQQVFNKWLFAREAESMGITVDNDTLNNFLKIVTNNALGRKEMLNILKNIRQGVSEDTFLAIVREELLALRYRQLFHQLQGIQPTDYWVGATATPYERWAGFKRVNEKATVEFAVFSPKDFTKQVDPPASSTGTLKQFFDEHKETDPSPYSPDPAFHVPRRVNVEYLEADEDKYRQLVTEDEISQRYQKDPHRYDRDKENFESDAKVDKADQDAAEKAEAERKAEAAKKTETEKKSDAQKQIDSGSKPNADKTEAPKTLSAPKPAETPTATKPAESKQPDSKPEPVKPAPAAKSSGSLMSVQRSPFRLVAYAEEKAADKTTSAKVEKKDAASQPPTPPAGKPAEEKKSIDAKKDEKKQDVKPAPSKNEDPSKPSQPPIKPAEERLRDKIRGEIATEKLKENLDKLLALLTTYYNQKLEYEDSARKKTDIPKPVAPDFAALAKEYHMTSGSTGLVSQIELRDSELGKAFLLQQGNTVEQLMFGPTTLFKPDMAESLRTLPTLGRSQYLFWKTDDQKAHVPKWEDPGVQAEVLAAWKLNEARKRATKRAEELKAEAKSNPGKSLMDLPSAKKKDFTLKTPPPFTFLTQMYGGRLNVGDVIGLDKISDPRTGNSPFMEKVFGLAANEADVATNSPKSEIYVVRVLEFSPFDELWAEFIADAQDWSIVALMRGPNEQAAGLQRLIGTQQYETQQAWIDRLYVDAGVKWETNTSRPAPDQNSGPPPGDDE
jgi:hypothetical protein